MGSGEWFFLTKIRLVEEEGPDHEKTFVMEVWIGDKPFGTGMASSKQSAEKDAAKTALLDIGILEQG